LEWDEEGGKIVIRRARTFTSEDIHRAIFGGRKPKKRTVEEMDEGIAEYIRDRYARH
jgi:hypothetical protein